MKRPLTFSFSVATSVLTVSIQTATAVPPPTGIAPVGPPPGGFSIDGDLLANTPVIHVGDWILDPDMAAGSGQGVLNPGGLPLDPSHTFHFVDPYNDTANDRIFGGGAKWPDDPNTWKWTSGKPSSKTDINNVLMHLTTDPNGHVWVVLGVDRFSTSGDSYIDFELLQNRLTRNANGTFTSEGPNGGRTTNDILLSIAFTGGGKAADFLASRWSPNGSGYAYTDITPYLPAGGVFVALNGTTTAAPYGAFGTTSYPPNAFAEAAIDLTAFLGNFDQCESFGFKTIMIKTKASASSNAGIEDFVDPIHYNLRIGPSAEAGPDQINCSEGADTVFQLQGSASSGVQPVASTTWSVVSGSAVIADPTSLATTATVSSPSATLRLTVIQANGCTKSDDIVLTVQQPPVLTITGPIEVCLDKTNTFNGPAGIDAYAWSIAGNGVILGSTTAPSVKVRSGTECGASFALTLIGRSNVCSVVCETNVLVADNDGPVLTLPPDVDLDCQASTDPGTTGMAVATDNCSRVTVTYADTVTNGCGVTRIIARTWLATDECGNAVSGVQTIRVLDNTPPTLVRPPDQIVECSGDTSPAATGMATATDLCGSAQVTYSDTVTPACGGSQTIVRKWVAMDLCGNTSVAEQTITVQDTTPPTLVIPASLTQEAPGDTRTNSTGTATAFDGCGTASISYSDVVEPGCGLSKTVRRLWTAVDQCGNATNALQIITVVDTQKPVVSSPALKVQCPDDIPAPYASLAAFLAGGGTATDKGSTNLTFALVSDGDLIGSCPGTVTRVYRITDECGNAADTTQKIIVDDTLAPIVICPPSRTVSCGDSLDPSITGTATASDNCDPELEVSYSDSLVDSSYTLNWYASDPALNSAPYLPTYHKFGPGGIALPTGGRAADPLRNAVAYGPTAGQLDALTSLGGEPFCLGQIVPFQAVIEISGGRGPENGRIEFTAAWATHTTSNDKFGYDKNYKVLCAFVDSADSGSIDPHFNAKVDSVSSSITNADTNDEKILGTVRVSGLDPGDRIVVEIWVALMAAQPAKVGGTIAADIILANKLTSPVTPISSGVKTISIGNLNKMAPLPPPQSQPPLPPQPEPPDVPPGYVTGVIDRTWMATDDCGNTGTCVQRFTILDDAAPQLIIPADVVLECPSATSTNICGVATALDSCGEARVTYSDSVSNCCGITLVISRVWTATDEWGNRTSATQTISVVDTTPPTLSDAPDKTVAAGEPLVFDTPTATDASGTAVVQVTGTTTNTFPDGSYAVTRTWCATDACGNQCPGESQTITVSATLITVPAVQQLTISALGPNSILLRWPTNAVDYRLESAVTPNAPRWLPVPVTPTRTNAEFQVMLPITSPSQFFRLSDGPPVLELSVSAGKLHLAWPTVPGGFQLETSDTMLPGSWTPVSVTPTTSNALNHVEVLLQSGVTRQFFRLRQ